MLDSFKTKYQPQYRPDPGSNDLYTKRVLHLPFAIFIRDPKTTLLLDQFRCQPFESSHSGKIGSLENNRNMKQFPLEKRPFRHILLYRLDHIKTHRFIHRYVFE